MKKDEKLLIKIFEDIVSKKRDVKVSLDSNLRDELAIDSIKLLNVILEIEKTFKIDMLSLAGTIDFSKVETVSDVMTIIDNARN